MKRDSPLSPPSLAENHRGRGQKKRERAQRRERDAPVVLLPSLVVTPLSLRRCASTEVSPHPREEGDSKGRRAEVVDKRERSRPCLFFFGPSSNLFVSVVSLEAFPSLFLSSDLPPESIHHDPLHPPAEQGRQGESERGDAGEETFK